MEPKYIDAKNTILGRLASWAAKQALLGNKVKIFNCEEALITGRKEVVVGRYHHLSRNTGQPSKGPFIPKVSDRFVRRVIRGMLPYKKSRGRQALQRIRCYLGLPEEFQDKKIERVKEADVSKLKTLKYIRVGDVCKALGGK